MPDTTPDEIRQDLDDMASLLEWVHANVIPDYYNDLAADLKAAGFTGKFVDALPRMQKAFASPTTDKLIALLRNTEDRELLLRVIARWLS